ncbi:MAG: tetratricopeptide repeat protein [Pirellulaceae bacterium]|nr:tetratricopeptide repeat protein [Pirellulaceae bacterium]
MRSKTEKYLISDAQQNFLILAVLIPTTLLAYAPALSGPRIFDDIWLAGLFRNRISDLTWWRPETRPLNTLSFILQSRLLGESNQASRLVNVAILVGSGMLLFELLKRCLRRAQPSLIATAPLLAGIVTLAWTLHPIQTQSIAYIIQRAESLMGLCFFGFLFCLILDQESIEKRSGTKSTEPLKFWGLIGHHRWKLLAVLCFLLGIWSKTIMLTAILVGPLFDRALLSKSWRDVWRNRGSIYALPIAASCLAVALLLPGIMVGAANVGFGGNAPPASLYFAGQTKVLWEYFGLILIPSQLSIDWGIAPPAYVSEMCPWITLTAILLAVIAFSIVRGRWQTVLLLSAPLLVLLPTSSFIPTADLKVEHRLYIPSAMVIAAIAMGVWGGLSRIQADASRASLNRMVLLSAMAFILALFSRTWLRCCDYQSGYRLWSQAVLVNPGNNRAIQSAIDAADVENRQDEIVPLLLEAIGIQEKSGKLPLVPLQRLGETLGKQGEHEKAIAALERSIEFDELERAAKPGGYRDIQRQLNRSASHINLAIARQSLGQSEAALAEVEQAIAFAPNAVLPRAIAGQFYRDSGQLAEALVHFERAAEIDPNSEEVRNDLLALRDRLQPQTTTIGRGR